jgi:hypothetical protein
MTLERFEPPRLVEYRSVQSGLPDARHERVFAEAGNDFDYRLVIEYEPRPGLRGLVDRTLVRRALTRAMRQTIANLKATLPRGTGRGAASRDDV